MMLRWSKVFLLFGVAIFYAIVVFNNLTDYNSNYQFVRHTLMMDTTFPGNHGMWRAINSPVIHTIFYLTIIAWESLTMLLIWWGALRLASMAGSGQAFQQAKGIAIAGLTLGLLQWLVAFLNVGGEWFLMWQSKAWNGQESAFRMFTMLGIVLILLALPEEND